MILTCHIFISGHVQGVGFRQFVKSKAKKMGVGGWVTNREDGKVEAVLQGEAEAVERLTELLRKGPLLAEVIDFKSRLEDTDKKYQSFEVVR